MRRYTYTRWNRLLAVLLCFCMTVSFLPSVAFAEDTASLCEHHPVHTTECGYIEESSGSPCAHEHNEICGYAHEMEGSPCNYSCKICSAQVLNNVFPDADNITEDTILLCEHHPTHTTECGYSEGASGSPCAHEHDEACGYALKIEGSPCNYNCKICSVQVLKNTFSIAVTPAGNASVTLQESGTTSSLDLPKIDVATENQSGRSFKYKILVKLSQEQFDQYVVPCANGGKWKDDQAKNFTITFPANLFDENLEVDWANVTTSYGNTPVELKSANADGIVLQGKQTSGHVTKVYADFTLYVIVPVTLSAEKYQAAAEKGSIRLNGNILVNGGATDANLSPLNFVAEHSIEVIDGNNLKHSLNVTDANGQVPTFAGTQWQLTGGEYTVSGTALSYEGLRITGDVTLNLDGAIINHTTTDKKQYAPAISIESGNVKLNLSNENTMQGSPGYAGIYVAEGATLTISGIGNLMAIGGNFYSDRPNYYAAGAGIGGNGLAVQGNGAMTHHTPNYGEINIVEGTVFAFGGTTTQVNYGAGAGIGNGGHSDAQEFNLAFSGKIHISGGTVTAVGGECDSFTNTGGGAGIGTGGVTGNMEYPYSDQSSIVISGGTVIANGSSDGAGVGSGANVNSNSILITGGTVTATGGDEGDGTSYGGAGIGGGDNGSTNNIVISGTADVIATGKGCAAGIGGGNRGSCNLIEISGGAHVVAVGGAQYNWASGNYGGAGIGSGRLGTVGKIRILGEANVTARGNNGGAGVGGGFDGNIQAGIAIESATVEAYGGLYNYSDPNYDGYGGAGIGSGTSWKYDNGCGTITITKGAIIRAYAGGKDTNAIGLGGLYDGDDTNSLNLDDTISLWAQTPDNTKSALLDVTGEDKDPISYSSSSIYLTVNELDSTANGWLERPAEAVDKKFSYVLESILKIDGNTVFAAPQETVGNWATLYKIPAITVSYEYVGSAPEGAVIPAIETIAPGTSYTSKKPADVDGWIFDGWYTDKTCTTEFKDNTELTENTTLYGRWLRKAMPVEPKTAVYRVEHYKQNLADDGYTLAATDFPLYGEIGATITAVAKDYSTDHYHLSGEAPSGMVTVPSVADGELTNMLVLKVYYDLDTYIIQYELAGGSGAAGVDYEAKTVKYGGAITLLAAPTRSGYQFVGWNTAENGTGTAYSPGDTFTVTDDTILYAQWQKNSVVPEHAYTSVSVKKVWKLDDGGTAADSVTIALCQNGIDYDTVVLSEANNWTYTWNSLDNQYVWTVKEVNVPEGFEVSIDKVADSSFTITNDDVPKKATESTDTTVPIKPNDGNPVVPQTGDSSNLAFWILLLVVSCGGLVGILVYGKKWRDNH